MISFQYKHVNFISKPLNYIMRTEIMVILLYKEGKDLTLKTALLETEMSFINPLSPFQGHRKMEVPMVED